MNISNPGILVLVDLALDCSGMADRKTVDQQPAKATFSLNDRAFIYNMTAIRKEPGLEALLGIPETKAPFF